MQTCLLYLEINRDIKGSKNKSVIWTGEENKLDQKLPFSLLKLSEENNVAKSVVDMWRNCSTDCFNWPFPNLILFQFCLFVYILEPL